MGVVFVSKEDLDALERKYIVHEKCDDGMLVTIKSAREIFDMMDMADCYPIEIELWELTEFGEAPVHRRFRGTWHNLKDPLLMAITDDDGNVLATGHGSDH